MPSSPDRGGKTAGSLRSGDATGTSGTRVRNVIFRRSRIGATVNLSIATGGASGASGPEASVERGVSQYDGEEDRVHENRSERGPATRDEGLFAAVARLTRPAVAGQTERQANDRLRGAPGAERIAEIAASIGGPSALFAPDLASRLMRAGIDEVESERIANSLDAALAIAAWWPEGRLRVQSPGDLAAIALPIAGRAPQEELHVAIVDGRNGLLALRRVYLGTATGTSVRIGELLRPVLDLGGVGFALVHNHPSGDPEPSDEDVRLTTEVLAAARLLDIEFLDHLVLGHGRWASIRTLRSSIWGSEVEGATGAGR